MKGTTTATTVSSTTFPRSINLDGNNVATNLNVIAKSVRIYTMFPQMPDPMPRPSTPPEESKEESTTRPLRREQTGRNPQFEKIYTYFNVEC
jgi:hypothetical protein